MKTRNQHKAEIVGLCNSGPKSSQVTPPKVNPLKVEISKCHEEISKIREEVNQYYNNSDDKYTELSSQFIRLSDNFQDMLKRLNLDAGSGDNPIHMHSANKTPELQELFATAHIVNVAGVIKINPSTWSTQYSHYEGLAKVLGGTGIAGIDYIEEIIQLPTVTEGGQTRYAVNIKYSNSLKRQLAVSKFKEICKSKNISVPVHFSLWKYPLLKRNVTALSNILKDMQSKGKIEWYSMNNFMAVNHMEYIAPMFTVKIPGVEEPTEYRSCPTNSLFHSGFYISLDVKDSESNEFEYLRKTIYDFIDEISNNNSSMKQATKGMSWADIVANSGKDNKKGVVEKPPVILSKNKQDSSHDSEFIINSDRKSKSLTNQPNTNKTPKMYNTWTRNSSSGGREWGRSHYSRTPVTHISPRILFPHPPPYASTPYVRNPYNKNESNHSTYNTMPTPNVQHLSPISLIEPSLLNPHYSPNYNIYAALSMLQSQSKYIEKY